MSTLADFFNAPTELVWPPPPDPTGKTYLLRQPDQLEEGMFQRHLEQRALDNIERSTYQSEARRDRDRQLHHQDVAIGTYEAGGPLYSRAVLMPSGTAKLLAIICRDQGMTDAIAKEVVSRRLREVAAIFISKVHSDPKDLAAVLATCGLPSDFFSSSSATPPLVVQETLNPPAG